MGTWEHPLLVTESVACQVAFHDETGGGITPQVFAVGIDWRMDSDPGTDRQPRSLKSLLDFLRFLFPNVSMHLDT